MLEMTTQYNSAKYVAAHLMNITHDFNLVHTSCSQPIPGILKLICPQHLHA